MIESHLRWFRNHVGLEILGTSLKSLELDSLQEIRRGGVIISSNSELCYANNISWTRLMNRNYRHHVDNNRDRAACGKYLHSSSFIQESAYRSGNV